MIYHVDMISSNESKSVRQSEKLEAFPIDLFHQAHKSLILSRTSMFYLTQWLIICIKTTQKVVSQKRIDILQEEQ